MNIGIDNLLTEASKRLWIFTSLHVELAIGLESSPKTLRESQISQLRGTSSDKRFGLVTFQSSWRGIKQWAESEKPRSSSSSASMRFRCFGLNIPSYFLYLQWLTKWQESTSNFKSQGFAPYTNNLLPKLEQLSQVTYKWSYSLPAGSMFFVQNWRGSLNQ